MRAGSGVAIRSMAARITSIRAALMASTWALLAGDDDALALALASSCLVRSAASFAVSGVALGVGLWLRAVRCGGRRVSPFGFVADHSR